MIQYHLKEDLLWPGNFSEDTTGGPKLSKRQMRKVLKAYSFHQPEMTSPYPENVLVRQYRFPNEYSKDDYLFQIYTEGWSEEEYKKFWHVTELTWKRNELSEKQLKKFFPTLEISLLDQQLENLSEEHSELYLQSF